MPEVWNAATPADGDSVSQGDDKIRELKRYIEERMETIVDDWTAMPLALKTSAVPSEIVVGTLAARPNPPTNADSLYAAYDTDQIFVSKSNGSGGFEWDEMKAASTEVPAVLVYSAAESRFTPLGTESSAQKVINAIEAAKLSSAATKLVWVPKSMWGYVAATGYSAAAFDSSVLMIREGGMSGVYDPIAYGADPTGTTNSQSCIDKCFEHAAAQGNGGIGSRIVFFSVVGTYLKNTDVDRRGCAMIQAPGVTHTGAGAFTGTVSWELDTVTSIQVGLAAARPANGTRNGHAYFSSDTNILSVWDGAWNDIRSKPTPYYMTFDEDAAAGSQAADVTIEKILYMRAFGTTDASGVLVIDFDDASFAGRFAVSKIHTITASFRTSAGGAVSPSYIALSGANNTITLDLDGGAQTGTWDLVITFTP